MKAKVLQLIKRVHSVQQAVYDLSSKMEESERYNELTGWADSAGVTLQESKYYLETLLSRIIDLQNKNKYDR